MSQTAAVLWLACRAAPRDSLGALIDLLRGRSVRGWNRLHRAAAIHPAYYRTWIRQCESAAVADWLVQPASGTRRATDLAPPRIGVVPIVPAIGGDAVGWPLPAGMTLLPSGPVSRIVEAGRNARCDWLLPLWPGTRLSPFLAAVLARAAGDSQDNVIYWDHDRLERGIRCDPVLKPAWDPLLNSRVDVLCSAALLSRSALERHEVVLADAATGEIAARLAALDAKAPRHIPLVLGHLPADHSVPPARPFAITEGRRPAVSILIPTRDRADLLRTCLAGLARLSYPGPVEIVVIDNGSTEPEALALLEGLQATGRATIVAHPGEFNFAAMINHGVAVARHDVLCLLNNDVEPLEGQWLEWMVAQAIVPRSGAVGARLLYPDRSVQHAGIAIGIGDSAGHVGKGAADDSAVHRLWHAVSRRVSAVTAACLVVERDKFVAVGGMDEATFAVDFNDVDLCLRLDRAGFANSIVAEATLVHAESKSRGAAKSGPALVRFERELTALRDRWGTVGYRDPWFHPLFRRESQECLLRF